MASAKGKYGITKAEFVKRATAYFTNCDSGIPSSACEKCQYLFGSDKCRECRKKRRKPYTVSGLCLSLGISKRQFAMLKEDESYAAAVDMTLLKIEAFIEENSILGEINGTLAVAILKEDFGWGEKEEEDTSVNVMMAGEAAEYGK